MNKQTTSKLEDNKAATKPDKAISVKQNKTVKGSGKRGKDKTVRKRRTDRSVNTMPGENTKYLLHDMKLLNLPYIDMENVQQVKQRINEYLTICAEDDIKPSIASLALSFHLSRFQLFDYINGRSEGIKNTESVHAIKEIYNTINSYYEHMMNNGRINPVAGIFLMKNNLGYRDETNYIVTAKQEQTETEDTLLNRAGLLTD